MSRLTNRVMLVTRNWNLHTKTMEHHGTLHVYKTQCNPSFIQDTVEPFIYIKCIFSLHIYKTRWKPSYKTQRNPPYKIQRNPPYKNSGTPIQKQRNPPYKHNGILHTRHKADANNRDVYTAS